MNRLSIPIRCAGITDCDPAKTDKPTSKKPCTCVNHQLYLRQEFIDHSKNCRLFTNLKTFEYDMALEGNNLKVMSDIYCEWIDTNGPTKRRVEVWKKKDWTKEKDNIKADVAFKLLNFIETIQNTDKQKMGKGLFAQKLAYKLNEVKDLDLAVPKYIEDAIIWVTKIETADA